jgi:hypothetical protein
VVSFTPRPLYLRTHLVGWVPKPVRTLWRRENLLLSLRIEPQTVGRPAHSPVTLLTELPRLYQNAVQYKISLIGVHHILCIVLSALQKRPNNKHHPDVRAKCRRIGEWLYLGLRVRTSYLLTTWVYKLRPTK